MMLYWRGLLCAGLVLTLGALLGTLTGCASRDASGQAQTVWATPSDEPEVRRRARVRLELAAGYLENGQVMVALEEVNQALRLDANFAAAHNLRGLVFMRLNDFHLAQESFQNALRLAPRDGDTWHNLGWMYCQQERHAEAVQAFGQALQAPAYASGARTWMAQGICQARAGQKTQAEQSLLRSFELDAANPMTLYNLAALLHLRGDSERARFYLRRLNNSELANAESLWLGVKIENRLQNRAAAQQLATQLLRRFPDSRQAQSYGRGAFDE